MLKEHKKIIDLLIKDKNDKKIDEEYLKEICEKFNIEHTAESLHDLIKSSDLDKDGAVGEEDLLTIFKRTNLF